MSTVRGSALLGQVRGNARLRWGLWTIGGILWLYGVLLLQEEVPRKAEALQAASRKLAITRAASQQTDWLGRRELARSLQTRFEAQLWPASSIGLAQASFHEWIEQAAQQARLSRLSVQVAAQVPEGAPGGLWKATARVSFDFSPQTLYPFLGRISSSPRHISIETLNIRTQPVPRAEAVLVGYFQASPARAQPAAQAAR